MTLGIGKYKLHVGKVMPTNNFGDLKIIRMGETMSDIEIMFLATGNTKVVKQSSLVRGQVKDKLFGVGFNSYGKYSAKSKHCYDTWKSMILRAYSPQYLNEHHTYRDVFVAEEWHDYQTFAEWYYKQPFKGEGYNIDKDLLLKGNKVYSTISCCFIPQEINKAIVIRSGFRGYGYHKRDNVYETSHRGNYLGSSRDYSLKDLQVLYLASLHKHIDKLAYTFKSKITQEVYNELLNYKLYIDKEGCVSRCLWK
tara:strand:- start:1198 stop:1953 length:756 start_codon:yes stop_codon:yes gene_type:complete